MRRASRIAAKCWAPNMSTTPSRRRTISIAPLQEIVTQYCWGAVWDRPGLDRKTRSIINLAMLSALNRPHEIKMHVKGALNNGLTKDEIKEVFLQVAIYCGVPAAVDSFRSAREVFAQLEPVKK